MAPLEDHDYLKLCASLASRLSISLSAARRQVEIAAAREGLRDLKARKLIAERLLHEVQIDSEEVSASANLDKLLEALAEDENFMVED